MSTETHLKMKLRFPWDCKNAKKGQVENAEDGPKKSRNARNILSFWISGICFVWPYIVMLSAAHDVLSKDYEPPAGTTGNITTDDNTTNHKIPCNSQSTGAILVANSLPSLLVKIVAAFFPIAIKLQIIIATLTSVAGYLLVALATSEIMVFLGVICTSLCIGLGEAAILRYSVYFHRDTVAAWASGTGTASIGGSMIYAAITTAGLSPRYAIYCMMFTPVLMIFTFWVLMEHPEQSTTEESKLTEKKKGEPAKDETPKKQFTREQLISRLRKARSLLKYSIPLFLVYFAEYFINLGLFELIYFDGIWLSHKEQYRWYFAEYQIAVFVSRTLGKFFNIRKVWIMPVLQFINAIIFLCHVAFSFIPNIWIVFALVIYEGILGGAAYVNILYVLAKEVENDDDGGEFAMMFVNTGEWMGIVLAGFMALPTHDYFCRRQYQ